MDGMSDIRNEIEQRLGVFARQGAKATMATLTSSYKANNLYKECVKWCEAQNERINNYAAHLQRTHRNDPVLTDVNRYFKGMSNFVNAASAKIPSSSGPQDVDNWLSNLRKFYNTLKTRGQTVIDDGFARVNHLIAAADRKKGYSRPGAKAKFSQVSQMLDMIESQARDQKDLAKKNLNKIADHVAMHGTDADFERFMAITKRLGLNPMARPGAKATMAISASDPRRELAQQVSANPKKYALLAMTKPSEWRQIEKALDSLSNDAFKDGDRRSEQVAITARRNVTRALLALNPSRNSRPGAKSKMGILDRISRGLSAATAKPVDPTTPQYLSGLTAAKKAAEEAKSNYEYMADLNDARFKQLDNYVKVTSNMITKMNSSADIQRLIAGLKAAVAARVFVQSSMKTPFSRPGSSQTFAYYDDPKLERELRQASKMLDTIEEQINSNKKDLAIANYNKVKRLITQEGNDKDFRRLMALERRLKSMSSRPGAKATAAKADDKTECETEQDKAGLKVMEKADKAVSDKIRTLIKEGKPQDQAVAIALDMKRRGEL